MSTWLFTIALNVTRDYQRLQKPHFWKGAKLTDVKLTGDQSSLASSEPSPETRLLAEEQASRVQLALKSLSPKQRLVFIMRFIDEMELPEISAITGMPLSTVKTHVRRAMQAVRNRLRGWP